MIPIRYEEAAAAITANIKESQQNRKLQAEIDRLTEENEALKQTLTAVITAFFREGAPAPNITPECWTDGVTYRVIQNGDYYTISRNDYEIRKEQYHEN